MTPNEKEHMNLWKDARLEEKDEACWLGSSKKVRFSWPGWMEV